MTFDPYAEFIRAVAQDPGIFRAKRCLLSRKALNDIGQIIETQPCSVTSTYVLDRAKRSGPEEGKALRQLHVHLRRAADNGLNPTQVSFLVRKLDVFPETVEGLQ